MRARSLAVAALALAALVLSACGGSVSDDYERESEPYTVEEVPDGQVPRVTLVPSAVQRLGIDPIWFGVIVTMLIEIAMISPPDGTIMYVLQGMRRTPGPITDVFAGVMPFVGAYLLAVLILLMFPQAALFIVPR